MIWAAMTLAFFGFLRLGELTCNSKFNLEVHLTLRDVLLTPSVNPASMTIRIKESKTDPFRIGQSITVGACKCPLCPVLAMKRYLSTRKIDNGPSFVHSSGHSFITYLWSVINIFKLKSKQHLKEKLMRLRLQV